MLGLIKVLRVSGKTRVCSVGVDGGPYKSLIRFKVKLESILWGLMVVPRA